jgi:hypothetical protein
MPRLSVAGDVLLRSLENAFDALDELRGLRR